MVGFPDISSRYIGSDGNSYQLDLATDYDVDLPFDESRDTTMKGGAKLATLIFLLDSKAHAWQTRVPFDQNYQQKRENDARDIEFCLRSLQGRKDIPRGQLRWIYNRSFWTPFLEEYLNMAALFRGAGLWTDETNFSSGSSRSHLSSRSNWHHSGSASSQQGSSQAGRSGNGRNGGSHSHSRTASRTGSRTS